jgi:hypothetical protein
MVVKPNPAHSPFTELMFHDLNDNINSLSKAINERLNNYNNLSEFEQKELNKMIEMRDSIHQNAYSLSLIIN